MSDDVVIVGGGIGAARTARALRDFGWVGPITIVTEEDEPPYDRPPLSKAFLLGQASDEDIRLLSETQLRDLDLDLILGRRAIGLDTGSHRLLLEGSRELSYGKLVIATGARARRIAALEDLEGVHYLRTAQDARALRGELIKGGEVGIVGGGFIGLEIASVATELGCRVTVVEAGPAPLAIVLGPEIGGWIQAWHERHGIEFRCDTAVQGAVGGPGIEALTLEDGSQIPLELVVVGVGVIPNVEWLAGSQLEVHRGAVCDGYGRTADGDVFVVGDAACRHDGGQCHLSGHWTAASDQASGVAETLMGRQRQIAGVGDTYFWSDQFGARFQFVGSVAGDGRLEFASGSFEEDKFAILCRAADDSITGVFAMNSPRDFIRQSLALQRSMQDQPDS